MRQNRTNKQCVAFARVSETRGFCPKGAQTFARHHISLKFADFFLHPKFILRGTQHGKFCNGILSLLCF